LSVLPPLSVSFQSMVAEAARGQDLPDLAGALAETAAPAYYLTRTASSAASTHQVGGSPAVEPGFVWPVALSFVAQIDLSALPPEIGLQLPQTGSLQFFVDALKQEDGPCTGLNRAGAVFWQREQGKTSSQPPEEVSRRSQDGVFERRALQAFPGLSLPPLDSPLLQHLNVDEGRWPRYAALAKDLRGLAAPLPVSPAEIGLQMGGHAPFDRDATAIDYRLSAVLGKHGLARDLAYGVDAVTQKITQYEATLPDWCGMLRKQLVTYKRQADVFEQEAKHLILLLSVPSVPELGMMWGDGLWLSYLIDSRDLARGRFEQAWALFHF
jgi:hypothetical protein